MQEVKVVSVIF